MSSESVLTLSSVLVWAQQSQHIFPLDSESVNSLVFNATNLWPYKYSSYTFVGGNNSAVTAAGRLIFSGTGLRLAVTTALQRKPLIRTDRSIKAEISSALPLTASPTAAKNTPPPYAGQLLSNHQHPPPKTGDNFMTTDGRHSQQFSGDTPERKIQRLVVLFCLCFCFYAPACCRPAAKDARWGARAACPHVSALQTDNCPPSTSALSLGTNTRGVY